MEETVIQSESLTPEQINSPDTSPSPLFKKVRKVLIVFSVLFFLAIGFFGWKAYSEKNNSNNTAVSTKITEAITPSIIVSPTLEISISPTSAIEISNTPVTIPVGAALFESSDLGIRFFYPEMIHNSQTVSIYETDRKVYVFADPMQPIEGQWVEVFEKDPQISLEEAINQKFLIEKDPTKCFVEIMSEDGIVDTTITKAEISFIQDVNEGMDDMYAKTTYCSEDYAKTNGIRYFWYDSQNPTKFLFFSIGQYGINLPDNRNWQDTIEVIN